MTKVEEDEDAYEGTLRDLDELAMESVDLVLIHRPPPDGIENLAVFDFEISEADMAELNERWSSLGMLQYA